MGVSIGIVRAAADTGGGTQDFTVSGLGSASEIKAVRFIVTTAVTDGTVASHALVCIGAASSTTDRWFVEINAEDAQTTTDTHRGVSTTAAISLSTPGTGDNASALGDINSFITDGVRVDWDTTPAAGYLITAIIYAGTDVSAFADAVDIGNTTDLATDITTVGFEPDLVHTALMNNASLPSSDTTTALQSLGAVTNDGAGGVVHRSWSMRYRSSRSTTESASRASALYGALIVNNAGNLDFGCEFGTFDSSGFTVTTRNAGGNNSAICFLALAFNGAVDIKLDTYTTPTTTGSDADTSIGFEPQYVELGLSLSEAVETSYTDNRSAVFGLSAMTSSTQITNLVMDEDGVTTSNSNSLSDNVAVNLLDDDGSTAVAVASLTSFDANGLTLNYTTAPGTAKVFWRLAIEVETAGGLSIPVAASNYRMRRVANVS